MEDEFTVHLPGDARFVLTPSMNPFVEGRTRQYALTANRAPQATEWGWSGDAEEDPTPIVITALLRAETRLASLRLKQQVETALKVAVALEYQGYVAPLCWARIVQQQAVEVGFNVSLQFQPTLPYLINQDGDKIVL